MCPKGFLRCSRELMASEHGQGFAVKFKRVVLCRTTWSGRLKRRIKPGFMARYTESGIVFLNLTSMPRCPTARAPPTAIRH